MRFRSLSRTRQCSVNACPMDCETNFSRSTRGYGLRPSELLGSTLVGLMKRANVDPRQIDQVVGGCVTQAGEQASNVTRTAWLSQALPYEVAATTVDCQCGSSQQANHFIANLIANDAIDFGIACGVESMSRVPLGSNAFNGPGSPVRATSPRTCGTSLWQPSELPRSMTSRGLKSMHSLSCHRPMRRRHGTKAGSIESC